MVSLQTSAWKLGIEFPDIMCLDLEGFDESTMRIVWCNLLNCDQVNFFKFLALFTMLTSGRATLVKRILIRMQKNNPDRKISDNAVTSEFTFPTDVFCLFSS